MSLIPFLSIVVLAATVLVQIKLRGSLKTLIYGQETLIESQEALISTLANRIDILRWLRLS